MMDRKSFLERLVLLGGGTLVVPSVLMQSCKAEPRTLSSLTSVDVTLLDELGEAIIPETEELPGAKKIQIGQYVIEMVNNCLSPEDRDNFLTGLNLIDKKSITDFGNAFESLDTADKKELLDTLQEDAVAFAENQKDAPEPQIHYFSLLKELVVTGYFTSEEIMTEGFDYRPIPGKYEGCVAFDASKDKIYKG